MIFLLPICVVLDILLLVLVFQKKRDEKDNEKYIVFLRGVEYGQEIHKAIIQEGKDFKNSSEALQKKYNSLFPKK